MDDEEGEHIVGFVGQDRRIDLIIGIQSRANQEENRRNRYEEITTKERRKLCFFG